MYVCMYIFTFIISFNNFSFKWKIVLVFPNPKQQNLHPEDRKANMKEGGKTLPIILHLAAVHLNVNVGPLFSFKFELFQGFTRFDADW